MGDSLVWSRLARVWRRADGSVAPTRPVRITRRHRRLATSGDEVESSRERVASTDFGRLPGERIASRSRVQVGRALGHWRAPERRSPNRGSVRAKRIRAENPPSASVASGARGVGWVRRTPARSRGACTSDSGDQADAALGPTGTEDLATVSRSRTGTESMYASALESAGLKGTLHVWML